MLGNSILTNKILKQYQENRGDVMSELYVEIKLPKCTVFLTPQEINGLLRNDPILWKESLRRGKYILRSRKQQQREQDLIK